MKPKSEFKNGWCLQFKQSLAVRAGVLLLCLIAASSPAQTFFVLHNFIGSDGANPKADLLLSGTTLYGTTQVRGIGGQVYPGTVFKVNTDGSDFVVIKRFTGNDGSDPVAGLVLSGTALYGTAYGGYISNMGTVFKLNTDGSGFVVLKHFTGNDGAYPSAGLVLSGTALYGTTHSGGISDMGTVFKLNTDGSGFNVLKQFTYKDGINPSASLALSGTTLYGTTGKGGSSNNGTIFRVNVDGSGYTVLKDFTNSNDGAYPTVGLMLSGTTLYGTTCIGGISNMGTVFKLNTDGSGFSVLKSFNGSDGSEPNTGLAMSGTALYGMTYSGGINNGGIVFMVNTDGSGYTVLKQFITGGSDFYEPTGTPVLSGMKLYGLTYYGGSYNLGTVFGLALPTAGPNIYIPPKGQTVAAGSTISLGVSASDIPPLAYQWFFSGGTISSTTTNYDLVLTNVQVSESGTYTVVVTNLYGSVTSSPARLDVIAPGDTTVRSCTEQALRVALTEGNRLTFACDGTITLGNTIVIGTNTVLDGNGHQVVISGGNLVRVFQVNANASLTLIELTIANGLGMYGGGIYNGGTVNATNCHFIANQAQGADDGFGGAVYNSGTLNIIDCSFAWNSASGGQGDQGEDARLFGMTPHNGGVGGAGSGGAICNVGLLAIKGSTFTSNSVVGGTGGQGGSCVFYSTMPVGGAAGGMGGGGNGSVLFNNGSASLVNSTFALNSSIGGAGGPGGGGSIPPTPGYGHGQTGPNGLGGSGFGAICDTNGHTYLTNCTLAFNSGTGSTAVDGIKTSGGQLVNTLLATTPPGKNCLGTITDAGHNISSDGSCAFSGVGSLNNTDPKLDPLADNGGSTLTMALLPGSPAIDAGDNASAPPTDQRGAVRPSGVACDIGAYEWSPPSLTIPPPTQTAEIGTTVELTAKASTFTPATYQWLFNGKAITGCTNSVLCLSGVQATNVGAYTLVVRNVEGVVTSSPAMLNVIPAVERRPVPAVKVAGEVGSLLNVDYANSLGSSPNWTPLGSVTLTSTSQFCPDLTMPLPPARFYRAWQTGTPGVVATLNLNFVPAIKLTGNMGDSLRLDCINAIGPTNNWVTLDTVTLTNTSQLYFDVAAPGQPQRLYRIVPAP